MVRPPHVRLFTRTCLNGDCWICECILISPLDSLRLALNGRALTWVLAKGTTESLMDIQRSGHRRRYHDSDVMIDRPISILPTKKVTTLRDCIANRNTAIRHEPPQALYTKNVLIRYVFMCLYVWFEILLENHAFTISQMCDCSRRKYDWLTRITKPSRSSLKIWIKMS